MNGKGRTRLRVKDHTHPLLLQSMMVGGRSLAVATRPPRSHSCDARSLMALLHVFSVIILYWYLICTSPNYVNQKSLVISTAIVVGYGENVLNGKEKLNQPGRETRRPHPLFQPSIMVNSLRKEELLRPRSCSCDTVIASLMIVN